MKSVLTLSSSLLTSFLPSSFFFISRSLFTWALKYPRSEINKELLETSKWLDNKSEHKINNSSSGVCLLVCLFLKKEKLMWFKNYITLKLMQLLFELSCHMWVVLYSYHKAGNTIMTTSHSQTLQYGSCFVQHTTEKC